MLVTVGDFPITANQLESAVASSPFATPFNAMDVDDQAAIRGNVLQRLVSSRLLYLEALRQGLDRGDGFRDEIEKFRLGLLYRAYMDRLRATIDIPEDVGAAIRQQTAGNSDARKAAEAAYRVDRFRAARTANLLELRSRYHVKIHESAIRPDAAPDTLLLDADGIRITLHDLLPAEGMEQGPLSSDWLRDRLVEHAEFLLVARAAEEQGVDLGDRLASFREERLPALLLERLEHSWLADEQVLRDYFASHPELGRLVDRWHIGQLVVASRGEAEAMRQRILRGDSLFELAGRFSIDPYGRSHKGDMGWVQAGQGMREVEQGIVGLADGQVSEVIETPLGFHLVTIIERRPGESRPYELVRDKVRQAYLSERMLAYIAELAGRYPVVWKIMDHQVSQN
ncbi:MAG: peptidylprolyl isomerase [Chromatiaceae bacterium]|nr:peptidylprolyl isomerase [Chromatiaceae bacterium]